MSGRQSGTLGRWGEEQVAEDLRRKGVRILAKNYRCRFGEIDLIAEYDKYLCFIEVKLRKDASFMPARCAVDVRKQHRLRITANYYLISHATQLQPRFDVVEVYAPQGTATIHPKIYYWTDAF